MKTSERAATVFLRRSVTLLAFSAAFLALLATSPAWLVLTAIVDIVSGARFAMTRGLLMVLFYLACEIIGVLACAGVWLQRRDEAQFLDANYRLQWWWAGTLFEAGRKLFALDVVITGADNARQGPVLVLVRHSSVADSLLAAALLSRPYKLKLRYVLKRELLWDPCLDIVGRRLPNAFVQRGSKDTAGDVAAVRALAEGLGEQDGVLLFPEGTRATPATRARALERLAASPSVTKEQLESARKLTHVLPPRLEGVLSLLEADTRADVLFVAHWGFDRVRTLADLRNGKLVGQRVRVHLWRCPRADVPEDREGRIRWLNQQWQRVNDFVAGRSGGADTLKSP